MSEVANSVIGRFGHVMEELVVVVELPTGMVNILESTYCCSIQNDSLLISETSLGTCHMWGYRGGFGVVEGSCAGFRCT